MIQIINITNPGAEPVVGDIVEYTQENGVGVRKQFNAVDEARAWRDRELQFSDSISQTLDHPERATYLTYRISLRDWPATGDFPGTKPELGS